MRRIASVVLSATVVVGAVVAAMLAMVGNASATPPKAYLVQFPTSAVTPTATFSVTVTNETQNTGMGAINLLPPSQEQILSMSVASQAGTSVPGVTWTASVPASGCVAPQTNSGNYPCVTAGGTPIGYNQTVTLTITVAHKLVCDNATPSYTWLTDARQSNSFSGTGNLLYSDPSSNSTLTVQDPSSAATHLVFTQQPNNALVGSTITGSSYSTSGPTVQVSAVNACGATDPNYSGQVTLSANPPASAVPSLGGNTATASGGVATFPSLAISDPTPFVLGSSAAGEGYTLTASSGTLASATSTSFDINDSAVPCSQSGTSAGSCTSTLSNPNGSSDVSTATIVGTGDPSSPNSSLLYQNVDSGTQLSCNFSSGAPTDSNWYQYYLNNNTWSKQITYDLAPTSKTNGEQVKDLQVCFGSTVPFVTASGSYASGGTLPNGVSGYVGLLPNCITKGAPTPNATYCIQSRSKVTPLVPNAYGFDFQVVISSPAGLADDPTFRL